MFEVFFNNRPYRLDSVELQNGAFFWSVCGSKKGSHRTGGGIAISDLRFLYGLCDIIEKIYHIEADVVKSDYKVCCFQHRNRVICGETRLFSEQSFYRIKAYTNYFKRNNEFFYYRNHELKPSGKGFYIQEFDFPISPEGIKEARTFSKNIQEGIETYLLDKAKTIDSNILEMANEVGKDLLELIRDEQIIVGGKPLWLDTDETLDMEILNKPLFDILCERLREEPLNSNDLATTLNLMPEVCEEQINPNSRYDYRFLERGLLLDRIRRGFNSLHYLVTQIPKEALVESPTLGSLFDKRLSDAWHRLINTTFSNDEHSQGRRLSYHVAQVEIESIEGGLANGISPELSNLRSIATRLFDLKRHFAQDQEMRVKVSNLIERFVGISERGYYE